MCTAVEAVRLEPVDKSTLADCDGDVPSREDAPSTTTERADSNRAAVRNQADDGDDYSNHQQDVDQAACNMEAPA